MAFQKLMYDFGILMNRVANWAIKFGVQMWEIGRQTTRLKDIHERYQQDPSVTVKRVDGLELLRQMTVDIDNMIESKTAAVRRIMDVAEQASMSHTEDSAIVANYYNAKRLNEWLETKEGEQGELKEGYKELNLTPNPRFFNVAVNLSLSAVHVPTNVFDGAPDVQNSLYWSERLNPIFVHNYETDPTLSWQFFGSSTGYMRQYPAVKWLQDEYEADLFDCRVRPWYIRAAASAKDMVILLDTSGSMTGVRKEIARHVVINLLETLSDNDFVNIFRFGETPEPIVPCFKDKLVQANLENIRELRLGLDGLETVNIANFSAALIQAFELLAKYNRTGQGAQCNQAIMIVSDGAPQSYQEIFEKYNWPHKPVRLFTYLIGREITDTSATKDISCENKGYFTHVTTLAEVREQVLKYIPVLARPMVLYQNTHPVVWSHVYADMTGKTANSNPRYRLMTTMAIPVYDRRNYTVRTANLLGVAGTDVPIKDFQKLTPAYKLGVNGYSFITTNNGYVLFHPDYRPVYHDILKPNFNGVDISEIELVDTDDDPRNNDTMLMQMRREMIEQRDGEMNMKVRVHYDNLKRASIRHHRYFYKKLKDTPFSLAIVQPEGYGQYRVDSQVEIKHYRLGNVSDLFKKKNWKVHPDWIYCQYMYDNPDQALLTPEAEVFHFMERSQRPAWKWRSRYGAQPSKDYSKANIYAKRQNKEDYYCDKDLFQSLVFDAIATQPFDEKGLIKYSKSDGDENAVTIDWVTPPNCTEAELSLQSYAELVEEPCTRLGILKMFGVSIIFVATRSGLLKWHDEATLAERDNGDPSVFDDGLGKRHFSETNNRAIDETWYKRAVEQNVVEPDSFVYSLPPDAGTQNGSLVTASHAIFVDKEGHKAPAAVVGLQFKHSVFVETFFNISHSCIAGVKCNRTCASEELECYVLDNNGFIIISEKWDNSGKFFGEVDGTIMDSLVHYEIYQKIRIYDYQSVCLDEIDKKSSASFLLTPLRMLQWSIKWTIGRLAWLAVQTQLSQLLNEHWAFALAEVANEFTQEPEPEGSSEGREEFTAEPVYYEQLELQPHENDNISKAYINRTRVRPCDRQVDLYSLQPEKLFDSETQRDKPLKGRLASCSQVTFGNQCGRSFTAHRIPHSNLILVVVDTLCPCDSRSMSVEATEVVYNETERCDRLTDTLFRQRPAHCISYHPEEEEIKLCGGGSVTRLSVSGLLISLLVILKYIVQS